MGKAYSEKEKEAIKEHLLELGVQLFHDNEVKAVNIRAITEKAGISQGGFYTFFKDKDAFLLETMQYRARQKIRLMEERIPESTKDPVNYLIDTFYLAVIDMKHKIDNQESYSAVYDLLFKNNAERKNGVYQFTHQFVEKLSAYWDSCKLGIRVDVEGICNVFTGAFLLFYNASAIESDYFDAIFKAYLEAGIPLYIRMKEKEKTTIMREDK